jgi:2-hydroxychromene-2-carboxylate isomerase
MAAPIHFLFDYLSPYAYIAWHQLGPIAARHQRAIVPVPVVLGAILNAHGNLGPAEIPAKRAYVFKDASRKAAHAGLPPLVPPPTHPFNPLLALRMTYAVEDATQQAQLITALCSAVWSGQGVETPAQIEAALEGTGLDVAMWMARAGAQEVKDRLRAATEAAIGAGVFGVPTFYDDPAELFWGVDALEAFDAHLGGAPPVPADLIARWETLPASASRR